MFTVVATIFQQIMTQLKGAETEKRRTMAFTKNYIKTHEAIWPLEFIGGKYECCGEGQQ
jgi:hypothetical protein